MTGILDVGDLTREVTIAGKKITINALGIEHVFNLIARFQSFQKMMSKAGVKKEDEARIGMQMLGADAMSYCIVACTGGADLTRSEVKLLGSPNADGYAEKMEKAKEEKWARASAKAKMLGAGNTFIILEAMYDLSFPDGFGPFVKRFMDLQERAKAMDLDMNSQEDWSAALSLDDPLMKYGGHPRARSTPGSSSQRKTALHS